MVILQLNSYRVGSCTG